MLVGTAPNCSRRAGKCPLAVVARHAVIRRHGDWGQFISANNFAENCNSLRNNYADNDWVKQRRTKESSHHKIRGFNVASHYKPCNYTQNNWLHPGHNGGIFIKIKGKTHHFLHDFWIFKVALFKAFKFKQIEIHQYGSNYAGIKRNSGPPKKSKQYGHSQSNKPSCCSQEKKLLRFIKEFFVRIHCESPRFIYSIIAQFTNYPKQITHNINNDPEEKIMSDKSRIVEGGQLFMHRMRMFKQTMKLVLSLSCVSIILLTAAMIFWQFDWYDCYIAIMYSWAKTKLTLQLIMPKSYNYIDFYARNLTFMRIDSLKFMRDPYVLGTTTRILASLKSVVYYSPILVLVSFVSSVKFFGVYSRQQRASLSSKKIMRGTEIVEPKELSEILNKQHKCSDLMLDNLPLVKDKETSHILITGTTGSGKTNCIHTLLPQIRRRGNSAIVIDMTGDLVSRYYRPGKDIILNPLDERSLNWNVWDECLNEEDLESFAEAFIPQRGGGQDPFWGESSRSILTAAITKTRDERDIQALYDIIVRKDLWSYHGFFEGTDAASYTDKAGGKTTLSTRSTLASHIACFRHLSNNQENRFSIRKWIKSEPQDQWVFITSTPCQRQLLRPLMSAWLNTAINGLMSLEPDDNRRLWLIIDELPSLNNIPALKMGLAEFRKYGGCILAGVQSFPQLSEIYGNSIAHAMLDLFNTKLIYRTSDPSTSEWASKIIGESEYIESQESLSFGANSVRDGVSLGKAERIKKLVLPSEVANLSDLECFVKYPGNYPSTRLKLTYKKIHKNVISFIEKAKANDETSYLEQLEEKKIYLVHEN